MKTETGYSLADGWAAQIGRYGCPQAFLADSVSFSFILNSRENHLRCEEKKAYKLILKFKEI